VSGSYDGIRVWDAETGETILGPSISELTYAEAAVYLPGETMVAARGWAEAPTRISGMKRSMRM
jgi:hypothetical protein